MKLMKSSLLTAVLVLLVPMSGFAEGRRGPPPFMSQSYEELSAEAKERLAQKGVTDAASFETFKQKMKERKGGHARPDFANSSYADLPEPVKQKLRERHGVTDEASYEAFKAQKHEHRARVSDPLPVSN